MGVRGTPGWGWRGWAIAGVCVLGIPGAAAAWLTVWLWSKGTRGAEIATVLALLVGVLGFLLAVLVALGTFAGKFPPVRRGRRPALVGAATGLLVVLAVAAWFLAPAAEGVVVRVLGCGHPVQLRVLSSPEQLAAARRLAGGYEQWTVGRNHGCQRAGVHVYAASPREVVAAMASGWVGTALRDVGPRPDVWLADSAAQVERAKDAGRTFEASAPFVRNDLVAWSPLVLGLAGPDAAALADGMSGLPWSGVFDEAVRRGWDVVRPDPVQSTMGQLGTALLYGDATRARTVEQRVGLSLDQGGYPIADGLEVLCRYRQLRPARTAVVVSEQALVRFNAGDPLGGGCGSRDDPRTGDEVLRAAYPSDTRGLDLRFVQLGWSGSLQQREAAAFGTWLTGDDGRRVLLQVGLRPRDAPAGDPLNERNGVLARATFPREEVAATVLDTALRTYDSAKRRGRVLLALDGSGSMGATAGPGQGTRIQVAARAVSSAVTLMGARDEFGLWIFPADRGGTGTREAVPIGERAGLVGAVPRPQAVRDALDFVPAGNTPLYRAVVDGVAALGPSDRTRVSALVVLTDGEDTTSDLTPARVRDEVAGRQVRVFVIAVGEATCSTVALDEAIAATSGHCVDADLLSIDSQLSTLFGVLWGVSG